MSRLAPLLLLILAAGCDVSATALVVQLKTDYVPGHEFIGVRTEYASRPLTDATDVRTQESVATGADDFLTGEPVAELAEVTAGPGYVRVTLLDADGATVAVRRAIVSIEARTAVTLVMTRSCEDILCPGPGDPPRLTECIGGACADPRCSIEAPEHCATDGCVRDADCPEAPGCQAARCSDGVCFAAPDDAACGAGERCDATDGCVGGAPTDAGPTDAGRTDAGPGDAGPSCPTTETACADGLDDDCDGLTDCEDPECDGAGCDDGVWCNGDDACAGGSCSMHPSARCPAFCDEGAMTCLECEVDADCGPEVLGGWGGCGGFSGTCGEDGTRSRDVTTPTCDAGACTTRMSTRNGSCTRDTDGSSCGSRSCTGWGGCSYSSTCDERASRSRTCTTFTCGSGSCRSSSSPESQTCTRDTDGNSCVLLPGCPASCVGASCNPICAAGCPC